MCLQNQHVVFAIDRAGLVGSDGETHQGIFDLSYLRLIPNMTIVAPKNANELEMMLEFAISKMQSPIAIRYPRGIAYNKLNEFNSEIKYGKAELLYDGNDLCFFALGSMVSTAVNLREKLINKNINPIVVNARFAKPIDYELIDKLFETKKISKFVIMEENVLNGGISQEVEDYIVSKNYKTEVKHITIPDAYVEHGDVSMLRATLKIDSESILNKLEL